MCGLSSVPVCEGLGQVLELWKLRGLKAGPRAVLGVVKVCAARGSSEHYHPCECVRA